MCAHLCHSGENVDERVKAVLLVLLSKCNHLKCQHHDGDDGGGDVCIYCEIVEDEKF